MRGSTLYKTRTFSRWSRKASLADASLAKVVAEMIAGLSTIDLGGNVYKKRVRMPGRGKRGGARVLIATDFAQRWFFIFGFEKSERDNISGSELAALHQVAAILLAMDAAQVSRAVESGDLTELINEEEPDSW